MRIFQALSFGGRGADAAGAPDQEQSAFKRTFLLVALVLLALNLGAGAVSWSQMRSVINRATAIYDTAFISSNYIHRAALSYEKYSQSRLAARTPEDIEAANDLLRKTIDELDVVIERSSNAAERDDRRAVREAASALLALAGSGEETATALASVGGGFDHLARRASAGGLKARDNIEAFSSDADFLLLLSLATSIALGATTLTILHRLIGRMTYLANYDALTKLPKRPLLHARLSECLRRRNEENGKFALLSLDLDRFKQVNDTLGHQVGDELLVLVAQRISRLLTPQDVAARFGGDEFVILKTRLGDSAEAGRLAERLVASLCAPYEIGGQQVLIGASVGIALAPEDGEYADDLLRNSDLALYRAKAEGKGRYFFFTAEMNAVMQTRRLLEIDLRQALERRQLEVHFQPLIDITSGQIISCEALVRWNHPTRGYIAPVEFLPLAEETGLIIPLGAFVLREACKEAASWTRDIRVAVNLSAVQFRANDLVSVVVAALTETGLPAHRLDLEITETLLMDRREEVVKTLTSLRDLGVRISLDDFGTGYSSLAYLSSFPFDKIKIDRSFVKDVANRSDSAAIIRAITSLAGTLGMCTTAEGVESVEELDWLRTQGCHECQGYLFSAPIPPRDLKLLLGMARGSAPDYGMNPSVAA